MWGGGGGGGGESRHTGPGEVSKSVLVTIIITLSYSL